MRPAHAGRHVGQADPPREVVLKTLVLMRHGKSSRKARCPDAERPLTGRGRRDAAGMGELVGRVLGAPDVLLSSTATRALDTAALAAEACGFGGDVQYVPRLYAAGAGDLVAVLRDVVDDAHCVLVVAHNPGLNELWQRLTGRTEHLPTAAVGAIELDIEHWSCLGPDAHCRRIALWHPRGMLPFSHRS